MDHHGSGSSIIQFSHTWISSNLAGGKFSAFKNGSIFVGGIFLHLTFTSFAQFRFPAHEAEAGKTQPLCLENVGTRELRWSSFATSV